MGLTNRKEGGKRWEGDTNTTGNTAEEEVNMFYLYNVRGKMTKST